MDTYKELEAWKNCRQFYLKILKRRGQLLDLGIDGGKYLDRYY
jgi:phage terminase large subunit-like protein